MIGRSSTSDSSGSVVVHCAACDRMRVIVCVGHTASGRALPATQFKKEWRSQMVL